VQLDDRFGGIVTHQHAGDPARHLIHDTAGIDPQVLVAPPAEVLEAVGNALV
jgi:hypothetical protein